MDPSTGILCMKNPDPDQHQNEKLDPNRKSRESDPDPHRSEKPYLDPDPL
jgi:hypothetical protein